MILAIQQRSASEGCRIPLAKLCRWFDVSRRTVYYRPIKRAPKVQARFSKPIKALIEELQSFGDRTVVHLLGVNKNTAQRVFQLKYASGPLASDLESRHCPQWRKHLMSAGRQTCA